MALVWPRVSIPDPTGAEPAQQSGRFACHPSPVSTHHMALDEEHPLRPTAPYGVGKLTLALSELGFEARVDIEQGLGHRRLAGRGIPGLSPAAASASLP